MSQEENKIKVVISPEALTDMEQHFSPEELQQLLAEFQQLVDSGEIFEQSTPVDMDTLEQDDPELYAQLQARMKASGFEDFDEWLDSQALPPTLN